MGSMHAVYSLSVVSAGIAGLQKAQIPANLELNLFHISMQCRWLRENKTCYACCGLKWQTNGEPCWKQSSLCHQWYAYECEGTENYNPNDKAHGRQIRKRQPSEEDASNVVELMPKPKRGRVDKPTAEMPWPANLAKQCPEMCTLQEMHRLVAKHPRAQAKFFLIMDDLVDRYLLSIGNSYVGYHRRYIVRNRCTEDDFCSSGEPGLAGFAENEMEPLESQKRGFTHGHRKIYGVPQALGPEIFHKFQAFNAEKSENETSSTQDVSEPFSIRELFNEITRTLILCASTVQYEAATLPATQMNQEVPPEKFTERQQDLSRLDGGQEMDGTTRDTLAPTPDEPLGHIAAEDHLASLPHSTSYAILGM